MKWQIQVARMCIGLVTFFNLQAAFAFLVDPSTYSGGFEVSGIPGAVVVRGMGILFVMWNIPYVVALVNPIRFRISLLEAIAMQTIGLTGESILIVTLPAGHNALRMTALRFIIFDASGVILLILAFILSIRSFVRARG